MATLDSLQLRLSKLSSTDALRELFAAWGYDADFSPVFLPQATQSDERAAECLAAEPEILARSGEFEIIYAPLRDWNRAIGSERLVISRLLNDHPFALWIFSDAAQKQWHFVNVKRGGKTVTRGGVSKTRHVLRRISLRGNRKPGRTICERLARLDLGEMSQSSLFALSPLQIQAAHDAAFDVESVTAAFYVGYRAVARQLQTILRRQNNDPQWAHALSLQTLNRLMFLRFIEKKEAGGEYWLGNDPEWSLSFWKTYQKTGAKEEFYAKWLRPLFFEAFNNSFNPALHPHFPDDIRAAFIHAPYLNGGLFKENEIDQQHEHAIPDSFFVTLFDEFNGERPGFFEKFNFTITEDSPFDQEVSVDPEMIGHVYESLINLSELAGEDAEDATGDARGDHGIFYTQRVEIDLMCRLALTDYLFNHLSKTESDVKPAQVRDELLEWVFAYEPSEKEDADKQITKHDWWSQLDGLLKRVTVCDPACGSGAFLVGMLSILDDLSCRVNVALGNNERPYDRCRRLIEDSLYGVDVMPWAAHVAELRLWLQLVIENDTNPRARKQIEAPEPLLPNLSFKVRPGDSLVQELGGVTLGLGDQLQISHELRPHLTALKTKKRKFFKASDGSKITQREIELDEKNLFADMLREKKRHAVNRLSEIEKQSTTPNLMGELPPAKQQKEWASEAEELRDLCAKIEAANLLLGTNEKPPFVWRLSFFEVFDGKPKAEQGFDIVVGNPPYVRQEKIAPPRLREDDYAAATWKKLKDDYKAQLQRSVQAAWPEFFEGGKRKLDGKSDLYLYFFLHGLKLLAPNGAFCFITSNSWLDVGYGGDLQEFLLKYGRVRVVFDNEVQRSFKSADVNTAVALLGCGERKPKDNEKQMARFIMWRVPFEAASNALVWQEIEASGGRLLREEYRLRPFSHAALLKDGADPEKEGVYAGNKWGGKFLRAPDIYDVILEKGKDKLVRLGSVADVRFGIKTGANEFFFLDAASVKEWGIEGEFLQPAVQNSRELSGILLKSMIRTESGSNSSILAESSIVGMGFNPTRL